ncbi:MAG: DsbA family protein [Treponema sp.]|nr:DsbA family protein [Treponema sp.]
MNKVQFFYAYECPFCKKGFDTLAELLPHFPETEIEWKPVELNPGPAGEAADPRIQGCYAAEELGADMIKFHDLLFRAIFNERRNTDDPEVLGSIAGKLADRAKFMELLKSGKYASKAAENNDLAYEHEGIWYVPAFRAGKLKLDSEGGVGVSKEDLKAFLEKAKKG